LTTLESLGWNATWAGHFEPHARAGLVPARVAVEHKELYLCLAEQGETRAAVSGRFRHLACARADFPAVGDWVALEAGDGTAVIHAVLPRAGKFSRKAPGKASEEQVLAANLDTLFVVTSCNRDFNPRRLERYLSAAAAGVQPVLLLNKRDLCEDPDRLAGDLRAVLPQVHVHALSALHGAGLDALLPYLGAGRTVALVGSSGVGKSTLLNRLRGQESQAVQPVRAGDDRGRHTTTHREMVSLPQGGLLIDNPGLRELQLWEDADEDQAFADIAELAAGCRFADCTHEGEPRCAVQQALADGLLSPERLESYRKLRRELAYLETRCDDRAERARKEEVKRIHRIHRTFEKAKRRRGR
jgi:ribosome biogenesis GTPase